MPSEFSMNYTGKKKEAERIDKENALMIERLTRQQSSINIKGFAKEFQKHLEFKRRKKVAMAMTNKAEQYIDKRKAMMRQTVG